jgi:predicted NBD/HSP70 family sugar kinase
MSYLLFDIGGTKIRIAKSDDLTDISETVILSTPPDFETGFNTLVQNAKNILGEEKAEAICGGIAGVLDRHKKELVRSPHLLDWVNKGLWQKLEQEFDTNVFLENDSSIVGLGEASKIPNYKDMIIVYYSVGTGIGGSRIVYGKMDANIYGFEPGHQIIDLTNETLRLEDFVSGAGLQKIYGKRASEIKDPKVWEDVSKIMAAGIHNSIVHWSPDLVILGGGIMEFLPINMIENHLKEMLQIFPEFPNLELAKLSDIGGIYGALEYLKSTRPDNSK